jgi:hypothetical protein
MPLLPWQLPTPAPHAAEAGHTCISAPEDAGRDLRAPALPHSQCGTSGEPTSICPGWASPATGGTDTHMSKGAQPPACACIYRCCTQLQLQPQHTMHSWCMGGSCNPHPQPRPPPVTTRDEEAQHHRCPDSDCGTSRSRNVHMCCAVTGSLPLPTSC